MKTLRQHAPLHLFVPDGFSGWWCERCRKPVSLPEELGAPARCPHCHKPTAVWIPESQNSETQKPDRSVDALAQRPRAARARQLFEHIHRVIEQPGLEPDFSRFIYEERVR